MAKSFLGDLSSVNVEIFTSAMKAGLNSPSKTIPSIGQALDGIQATVNGIIKAAAAASGPSITVPLAKLTTGGAAGTLTFTNGILTAYVLPN